MSRAINYIIDHRCEICDAIWEGLKFIFMMIAPISVPFIIIGLSLY